MHKFRITVLRIDPVERKEVPTKPFDIYAKSFNDAFIYLANNIFPSPKYKIENNELIFVERNIREFYVSKNLERYHVYIKRLY